MTTPRPEESPAHARIEGAWEMIRAEFAGEDAPELVVRRTELALEGGRYSVRFDGQVTDEGTYELGETPERRTIVLKGESGPNAGQTIPGIYQLMGDRLRVCYGFDRRAPTAFTTSTDDRRYLATYRRREG